MTTEKEDRDMEELITGNKIDYIWGADDHGIDNDDLQDCADQIGALVVVG
jgi:hypothetical protein